MQSRRGWRGSRVAVLAAGLGVGASGQEAPPKPGAVTEGNRVEVPKEGAVAPALKLKDHDGKEVTLAQFAGKKNVLLAFFPKAFTGG